MSTPPAATDDRRLLPRLVPFIKPHLKLLAVAVVLVAVLAALDVALPYLMKVTIDERIAGDVHEGLLQLALLYAGAVIAKGGLVMVLTNTVSLFGQRAILDLRRNLHSHLLSRSASFYDRTPVGKLLNAVTGDVEEISALFSTQVISLFVDVISFVAILIMMFYLSATMSIVTLTAAVLMLPLFRWTTRATRAATRAGRAISAELSSFLMERLGGAVTLQTLGRTQDMVDAHREKCEEYRRKMFTISKLWVTTLPVADAMPALASAGILWYAAPNMGETLTIGLVVAFIEYSNRVFGPITSLAQKAGVLQSALAGAERIFALLDNTDDDAPGRERSDASASTVEPPASGIEFRDVRFGYNPNDPVLHGVTVNVPAGATVAIVGATGSGKSTLARLLARQYQSQGGSVHLDGRDVRDMPIAELRRRVTLIAQDVFLFSGTIADNVRLARPDASQQDVEAALARVGLLGRKSPDTKLVGRGANLSHGERQLVAFARALVRDPEILVLDEATANVDPETEQLIERALVEMFTGRTCLIIAHRLATIRRADRIVVMDKGRVVESGTREELLALGGLYARLEQTGGAVVS